MESPQNIANDNERIVQRRRIWQMTRGHVAPAGRNRNLFSGPDAHAGSATPHTNRRHPARPITQPRQAPSLGFLESPFSNILALVSWIASFVLIFYALDWTISPIYKLGASVLTAWSSLFLILTSRRQNRPGYRALGVLGLLSSLLMTGFIFYTGYNLQGSIELLLCIGAFGTAFLGAALKEKLLIVVSTLLTIIWSSVAIANVEFTQLYWLFPAMASLQLYGAELNKSRLATILAVGSAYLWLGTGLYSMVISGSISPIMSASALIVAGTLHYVIGKLLQDRQQLNGLLHTCIGWCAFMVGLLLFQDYGFPEQKLLSTHSLFELQNAAEGLILWCVVMCMAVIGITAISSVHSKNHKHSNWKTAALVCATVILLVYSFNPQAVLSYLASISSQPAMMISLVTGGFITGLALSMTVNGARRSMGSMILLGLAALSLEAILIMDTITAHSDNLLIYGISTLMFTLMFAGMAYKNITHVQSPSYQYART